MAVPNYRYWSASAAAATSQILYVEKFVQIIELHCTDAIFFNSIYNNHFSFGIFANLAMMVVDCCCRFSSVIILIIATYDVRVPYNISSMSCVVRVYIYRRAYMHTGTCKFKVGGNRSRCHNVLNISSRGVRRRRRCSSRGTPPRPPRVIG